MDASISEGHLPVKEGSIYWNYASVDDNDDVSRPVLLFIHAGVSDHALFDSQVKYLNQKGWSCLRFDLFGYGSSHASEEYLHSDPREPFDAILQIDQLRKEVLPPDTAVIPIGLSVGGNLAIAYTVQRPENISGLVVIAGGLRDFEHPNTQEEEALFAKAESLIQDGDVQGSANLQVRIWGDGPLQEPGRMDEALAEQMLKWNTEIASRECARTGGFALEMKSQPLSAASQLHTISVPTLVGYGTYDETNTTEAMKHVGRTVKGASAREFPTAHMVNMEVPDQFNEWLGDWLQNYFLG